MLLVAALTAAGGLLRLSSLGRLGLVHFDEGIYAMAGTWVLSPRGLPGLDPALIPYAPPGFPILVGLAYMVFGVSDISAILVSITAGTLTIPVVGWLACRTFGRGAGAAASAFAAFSGPHIAFSRMALTDGCFLLAWLISLALGQRFVERPSLTRAIAMGCAVGAAQFFKYNGWLAGFVVVLGALATTAVCADERLPRRQIALWGWGAVAALTAAVVYSPWIRYVETHGGYAALLAHHRSYLGGLSSWPGHALLQLQQDRALSGGILWMASGAMAGAMALLASGGREGTRPFAPAIGLVIGVSLTALGSFFQGSLFGAVLWLIATAVMRGRGAVSRATVILAAGWGVLAIMTPFYHPYARLLLPLHAFGWILVGGAFSILGGCLERLGESDTHRLCGVPRSLLGFATASCVVPLVLFVSPGSGAGALSISELLEPTDSIRRACQSVSLALRDGSSLRSYARPPVTFYLSSGGVSINPQSSLVNLLTPAPRDPSTWALLDSAMVRQGVGMRGHVSGPTDRWELVQEFPTVMNLPTFLDVDPSAARAKNADRSAPLFLFRPRLPGVPP